MSGIRANWNPERRNLTKGTDVPADGSGTATEGSPPKLSCLMRLAETPCSLSNSDTCSLKGPGPQRKKVGTRKSDTRLRRNSWFKRPLLPFHPASGALNVTTYRNRAKEWLRRVNSRRKMMSWEVRTQ